MNGLMAFRDVYAKFNENARFDTKRC